MKTSVEMVIEYDEDKTLPEFPFFKQLPSPVQIQAFERFAKKTTAQGVFGMANEFKEQVKYYANFTKVAFEENQSKNRYKDVYCGDATRVVLPDNGYIHANYVKGPPLYLPFILCQGPLPSTLGDFWKMVDTCKVTHIIMLCDTVEMGRPKCEQYIPLKPGEEMTIPGGYRLIISEKNGKPEVDMQRTHTVTKVLMATPTGSVKKIRHYHYRTWPDKGTPPVQDVLGLLKIIQKIRTNTPEQHALVHCSAGIGRTGTLVAIEMCLHQLLGDPAKPLDLVEMGKKLRDQRPGSIQVELQYVLVAVGIFDYGTKLGFIKDKEILAEVQKFMAEYDRITRGSAESVPPVPPPAAPTPPPPAQPAAPVNTVLSLSSLPTIPSSAPQVATINAGLFAGAPMGAVPVPVVPATPPVAATAATTPTVVPMPPTKIVPMVAQPATTVAPTQQSSAIPGAQQPAAPIPVQLPNLVSVPAFPPLVTSAQPLKAPLQQQPVAPMNQAALQAQKPPVPVPQQAPAMAAQAPPALQQPPPQLRAMPSSAAMLRRTPSVQVSRAAPVAAIPVKTAVPPVVVNPAAPMAAAPAPPPIPGAAPVAAVKPAVPPVAANPIAPPMAAASVPMAVAPNAAAVPVPTAPVKPAATPIAAVPGAPPAPVAAPATAPVQPPPTPRQMSSTMIRK